MNRRNLGILLAIIIAALLLFFGARARDKALGASTRDGSASGETSTTSRPHAPRVAAPQRVLSSGGEVKPSEGIGHLEGRVVSSSDDQPIINAEVVFIGPDGSHSVRTREEGRFDFGPG